MSPSLDERASGQPHGMMRLALRRLAGRHPFFAALVTKWECMADASIPTGGVTVRAGVVTLVYNPSFVVTLIRR